MIDNLIGVFAVMIVVFTIGMIFRWGWMFGGFIDQCMKGFASRHPNVCIVIGIVAILVGVWGMK